MVKLSFEQARGFLSKVSSKDKIAIIHHDDLDGFASAIIFYDFCKSKKAELGHFSFSIGRSRLGDYDLDSFNKIIIVDISCNLIINDIDAVKEKEVFYTDHHPREFDMPDWVLEYRALDLGYIPSSRTSYELTGLRDWLALTGVIADVGELYKENDEFIGRLLRKFNFSLEEIKDISYKISNFLIYFFEDRDKAFDILEKLESIEDVRSLKKYFFLLSKRFKNI